jgi:hypothetical protein
MIVEAALGRLLRGTERVHHADGDPTNNHPSNLVVAPTILPYVAVRATTGIAGGNPTGGSVDLQQYDAPEKCTSIPPPGFDTAP